MGRRIQKVSGCLSGAESVSSLWVIVSSFDAFQGVKFPEYTIKKRCRDDLFGAILSRMTLAITTGQELDQNHRFKNCPGCLLDAMVPRRLVGKKGDRKPLGTVLTLSRPLELYSLCFVASTLVDKAPSRGEDLETAGEPVGDR
jgi:hypothetical protein